MSLRGEPSARGTWTFAFAIAFGLHAALVGFGLAAMAPPEAVEQKQTEINVSAMTLEAPAASTPRRVESNSEDVDAQTLEAVGADALEASGAESLEALADTESVDQAESDRLSGSDATAADAVRETDRVDRLESAQALDQVNATDQARVEPAEAVENTNADQSLSAAQADAVEPSVQPAQTAQTNTETSRATQSTPTQAITGQEVQPARATAPSTTAQVTSSASPTIVSVPSTASVVTARTESLVTDSAASTVSTVTQTATTSTVSSVVTAAPSSVAVVGQTVTASEQPEVATSTPSQNETVQVAVATPSVSASPSVVTNPDRSTNVAAVAPSASRVTAAPSVVTTITPTEDGDSLTGGEVASSVEPEVLTAEESMQLYQDMLSAISDFDGGNCFAALPELNADGEVSFRSFARTAPELDYFKATLEAIVGYAPPAELRPIASAQCAALEFASLAPTYPQFRMFLDLDESAIAGRAVGNNVEFTLAGIIGNVARGNRYLIIVDDDGLVQNLSDYTSPGLSRVGFRVGLTFKGDRVQTEQLIMAIQSSAELPAIRSMSGSPAPEFFQRLGYETVVTGADIDLAIASFIVR